MNKNQCLATIRKGILFFQCPKMKEQGNFCSEHQREADERVKAGFAAIEKMKSKRFISR